MSGESKEINRLSADVADNRMLADVTDAYLKATSDAIAKGKSSEWASANSILLAYENEKATTEGMLQKIENDFTQEDINRVKEEIKVLLRTTPYSKIPSSTRCIIKAFEIYNSIHGDPKRRRCLKIAKKRALDILNSGKDGCQIRAATSFLNDAKKWKLYDDGNLVYDTLIYYKFKQPEKIDADFINGFN